jgi:hydroxylamine reductase (hybrid-cluster protein)
MPKYPHSYLVRSIQKKSKDTCTYEAFTYRTQKQQLPVCNKQQHLTENATVVAHSSLHMGIKLHVLSTSATHGDDNIYSWFV